MKIYTVSYVDTYGCEHAVNSGHSYTPFSTETLASAKAMATRIEKRKRNITKIRIYECDFEAVRINLIETRAAVLEQQNPQAVKWCIFND